MDFFEFVPDLPLLKILQYAALSHDTYQENLLYVCKRWTAMLLIFCFISIFQSEENDYDKHLRHLISNFARKLSHLRRKHHSEIAEDISATDIYRYFSDRRISFSIFNKTNLFYIKIFDRWGRKCVNRCCEHSNCQGAVPPIEVQKASGKVYVKDSVGFPYYYFYYYKCRFVQRVENNIRGHTARRELFCASMQFVIDVNDILQPHMIKEKCIPKLEKLLSYGIEKGYHANQVAFRVNIDLCQLRLQMETNEADLHDETDEESRMWDDLLY